MIGEDGYDDFLDTGIIQAAQDTKQEYEQAYFFKGCPINRYARNGCRVQYFVEAKPQDDLFASHEGGYPFATRPVSAADQIKIYRHSVSDGAEVVFDSFKEAS